MPGLDPSLCPSGLVRDGAWNIDRSTHKLNTWIVCLYGCLYVYPYFCLLWLGSPQTIIYLSGKSVGLL